MSKSYNNTIDMFTTSKERKKQVMKIVTDSKELDEPKSGKTAIFIIFQNFYVYRWIKNLQKRYETPGEGYGHFKLTLLEKIESI